MTGTDERDLSAAFRELATRCRPALFSYPVAMLGLLAISPQMRENLAQSLGMLVFFLAFLVVRYRHCTRLVHLTGPYSGSDQVRFSLYALVNGAIWSLYAGYLNLVCDPRTGTLVLLSSVAFGAGAVSSMAPNFRLYLLYLLSLGVPSLVVLGVYDSPNFGLLAGFYVALAGVALYMSWTMYRSYWVQLIGNRISMEEVASARERLEMVVSGSNLGAFDWRLDTREFYMDCKGPEALGYPPEDFDPWRGELEKLLEVEDLCEVRHRIIEVLQNKDSQIFSLDLRLKALNGPPLWFSFRGRVVERSLSGRALRVAGTYEDITREKETAEQMLDLRQRVDQAEKFKTLGVLAGGVAHDFNNLLTAFVGNLELALMDIPDDSPAIEFLEEARRSALSASELCNQLLAYAGKAEFHIETFSLNSLVTDMVHLLQVTIGKNHTLQLALDAKAPMVQGDPSQIRQVLLNLLTNAAESMGDKGGTIQVTTSTITEVEIACAHPELKPGSYICLSVVDQGAGMPQELQDKIFDPFFTTKFTGRGLGLASVQGIIRGHEGKITVQSNLGVGTMFRVYLPATDVAEGCPVDTKRQQPQEESGLNILVVDDETPVRTVLNGLLAQAGHEVLLAQDGISALEQLVKNDGLVDLVILDLVMPRKDGYETLSELRSCWPTLPVILSSGFSESSVKEKALSQSQGFLKKPFRREQLFSELQKALHHSSGGSPPLTSLP